MGRTAFGAVTLLMALPALAHHSFAMFDTTKPATLTGTVKEFQWNNPHCFLQVVVQGQSGIEEWSVEMGAPAHLVRAGLRPSTFKLGDKVAVVIFPLRDGAKGGNFVSATGPDGMPIGQKP